MRSPINPHGLPVSVISIVEFEDGTTVETTLLPSRTRNLDVEIEVETVLDDVPWKTIRKARGEIDFVRVTLVGGHYRSVYRRTTERAVQVQPEAIEG